MDYAEFKEKFGISEKQAGTKPPVDSGINRKIENKTPDPDQVTNPNAGEGDTDTGETSTQTTTTEQKIELAAMEKKELLAFIGKRNLYEKSYKNLEPEAIIPLVIEKARNKIVEAKLKTAEEAAVLSEGDLLALFDTIGK